MIIRQIFDVLSTAVWLTAGMYNREVFIRFVVQILLEVHEDPKSVSKVPNEEITLFSVANVCG